MKRITLKFILMIKMLKFHVNILHCIEIFSILGVIIDLYFIDTDFHNYAQEKSMVFPTKIDFNLFTFGFIFPTSNFFSSPVQTLSFLPF